MRGEVGVTHRGVRHMRLGSHMKGSYTMTGITHRGAIHIDWGYTQRLGLGE